jgi:hypothetical protein
LKFPKTTIRKSTSLLCIGLFWFRIPGKRFFGNPLWIVFACAAASIATSPFVHYPVAYTRLLHLLTPIVLFSFLSAAFTEEEKPKILRLLFTALIAAGLVQTGIAIAQYFHQAPLGLRLLGETTSMSGFTVEQGRRWIFDRLSGYVGPSDVVIRASATFPHANILGGFLALSLLVTYWFTLQAKKGKVLLSFTIPFQVFALMLTFSRSAFFGWGLGSAIWFVLLLYKKQRVQSLAAVVAISVAVSTLLLYDQLGGRGGVINYNAAAQGSDQIRIEHQNTALKIIQNNPLLGLGFAQFSERAGPYFPPDMNSYARLTAPHNIFLFLACETGLISLAAFLLFASSYHPCNSHALFPFPHFSLHRLLRFLSHPLPAGKTDVFLHCRPPRRLYSGIYRTRAKNLSRPAAPRSVENVRSHFRDL